MNRLKVAAWITAWILSAVAAWEVAIELIDQRRKSQGLATVQLFVPKPSAVANSMIDRWSLIADALLATVRLATVGLVFGAGVAIATAVVLNRFGWARPVVLPLAYAVSAFPIVGLAPAFVLMFGQGSWHTVVLIAAVTSYLPTLLMVDAALTRTERQYSELALLLDASHLQAMRYIKLPLVVLPTLTALRIAAPAAMIGATIAEWLGAPRGIGVLMTAAMYQHDPALLFASLLTVAATSSLVSVVIYAAERRLQRDWSAT